MAAERTRDTVTPESRIKEKVLYLYEKQSNICSFIFNHSSAQTEMTTEVMTLIHSALQHNLCII